MNNNAELLKVVEPINETENVLNQEDLLVEKFEKTKKNRTSKFVRVTHQPTGIQISTREQDYDYALEVMQARLDLVGDESLTEEKNTEQISLAELREFIKTPGLNSNINNKEFDNVERLTKIFSNLVKKVLLGYNTMGINKNLPEHGIITCDPHTSNLDAIIAGVITKFYQMSNIVLMKEDIKKWPLLNKFAVWIGAVFIDRASKGNTVGLSVDKMLEKDHAYVSLMVEGTRARSGKTGGIWKTGWYNIKKGAEDSLMQQIVDDIIEKFIISLMEEEKISKEEALNKFSNEINNFADKISDKVPGEIENQILVEMVNKKIESLQNEEEIVNKENPRIMNEEGEYKKPKIQYIVPQVDQVNKEIHPFLVLESTGDMAKDQARIEHTQIDILPAKPHNSYLHYKNYEAPKRSVAESFNFHIGRRARGVFETTVLINDLILDTLKGEK